MGSKSKLEILNDEPSDVQEFYDGCCIFITGGSGFLGNLLIQKLIRDCPDLSMIYLLMRDKKGVPARKRLEKMLAEPVFERMRMEHPKYMEKIQFFTGDLNEPSLGLSEEDYGFLCERVNIIFHVGASIRFDDNIKDATFMNTRSTRDLLIMARSMSKLKAFVYCSTAFANCHQETIDEVIYNMPCTPERLLEMVELLNEDELKVLTEKLIDGWPNTYLYTKCMAENIISQNGKGLPITIVRPSIVTPTMNDPLSGWINNVGGAVGLYCLTVYGILRIIPRDDNQNADYVPGDYVVNHMIVAAQYVGTTCKKDTNDRNDEICEQMKSVNNMTVFNCISGVENPFTWTDFKNCNERMRLWPPAEALWYSVSITHTNPYIVTFIGFFLNLLPAYIFDFLLVMTGRKDRAKCVKAIKTVHSLKTTFAKVLQRDWHFKNKNSQILWNRMNLTDKKLFHFSVRNIDWGDYCEESFARGIYLYIMKNSLDKVHESRARLEKLKYLHYFVVYSFYAICLLIVYKILTLFI